MTRSLSGLLIFALFVCGNAHAGSFRHAKNPLKNRYIVVLTDVAAEQVPAIAQSLIEQYGGQSLGVMTHALRGFGVVMTEARARALSHHPLVELVEEDTLLTPAASGALAERATLRHLGRFPIQANANLCPWYGSYYACYFGDDTYWALDRIDNTGPIYGTKAYAYNTTGSGVRAYVIGWGIYGSHTEFDGRVETGAIMTVDPELQHNCDPSAGTCPDYEEPPLRTLDGTPANFPCGAWQSDPNANQGHDTGVASVIAGSNVGVAKQATLVPVKITTCSGNTTLLATARGLDWIRADVVQHAPSRGVVNISWVLDTQGSLLSVYECEDGHGGYTNCLSAIEHAINSLSAPDPGAGYLGVPVVVSAGNQSNDVGTRYTPARMGYPAPGATPLFATPNRTITVGGTMAFGPGYADQRWTCAGAPEGCEPNWGAANPGSNYGVPVSIWAPAWNVYVAGASGATAYRTTPGSRSGTSFAAPVVAGMVARILQANPSATVADIWSQLASWADSRGTSVPSLDPSLTNRRLAYVPPSQ